MATISWAQAVEKVVQHVVKISTPNGSGTGFLSVIPKKKDFCGIATASHVIEDAKKWELPLRISHPASQKEILLHPNERAIFLREEVDTAAIVIAQGLLPLPDVAFPLTPDKMYLSIGQEVGWLGFPAIPLSAGNMCFFSGRVSCWLQSQSAYLVDGVAINGVSGGPVFYLENDGQITMIGVITNYAPNRATGETLPGLCVARDVAQFQDLIRHFDSMGEAKEEATKEAATEEASESTLPARSPEPPETKS